MRSAPGYIPLDAEPLDPQLVAPQRTVLHTLRAGDDHGRVPDPRVAVDGGAGVVRHGGRLQEGVAERGSLCSSDVSNGEKRQEKDHFHPTYLIPSR